MREVARVGTGERGGPGGGESATKTEEGVTRERSAHVRACGKGARQKTRRARGDDPWEEIVKRSHMVANADNSTRRSRRDKISSRDLFAIIF